MTCEAAWMVASFQSTILPFIHTLPVPLNAMGGSYQYGLLGFTTKRAALAARGQRLAAIPTESSDADFARAHARRRRVGPHRHAPRRIGRRFDRGRTRGPPHDLPAGLQQV